MKLFMILLGAMPKGRKIEQHDIFFGIAENLRDLVPAINEAWPEAIGRLHIDGWREVNYVDGYGVRIKERKFENGDSDSKAKLFFINLGGYKENEFEEFHYKMIVAGENKGIAVQKAKQTAFYKHTGFQHAPSHIDDRYGVDVDDVFEIEDILSSKAKEKYAVVLSRVENIPEDPVHLGYYVFDKL